jgi:tetratricopeptide (TPR) repeat protein
MNTRLNSIRIFRNCSTTSALRCFGPGILPKAWSIWRRRSGSIQNWPSRTKHLGVALGQSGRVPEAIEQFQAVIQLDPQSVTARDNLAYALVQTGHIPEAIEQFQHVLQINPADVKARESLSKLQQYELQQGVPTTP